ncbi:MAG: hypothetical protein ACRBBP_09055 [Bdellovibrionales bacterium]
MRFLLFISLFLLFACKSNTSNKQGDSPSSSLPIEPACNKSLNKSSVDKPTGIFTSVITSGAVTNPTINGGLIRVTWAELETSPGVFDFSSINEQIALLPEGKKWSLGVHGGWSSVDLDDPDLYDGTTYPDGSPRPTIGLNMVPPWLVSTYNVETFTMAFRSVTVEMPKYWDINLQSRLNIMLQALATEYKSNSDLQLVYVPQMTSNGLEGHFNGVDQSTLISAAGVNPLETDAPEQFEDVWVQAALDATEITAQAFDNKAIAFEVHEVIDRVSIPQRIMDAFLSNMVFENRVGIGMWWISGGTTYQPDLVKAIKNYEGDLYGQIIGNSSQPSRFLDDDYTSVFTQAKELCMRYIEPWNYEFENNTFDEAMNDFNTFSNSSFE